MAGRGDGSVPAASGTVTTAVIFIALQMIATVQSLPGEVQGSSTFFVTKQAPSWQSGR
jgi:hypothetical protein